MQILDAAARLVIQQGFLPLPIEGLAREAGTSKALIYAYFPTQFALFNALIEREWQALSSAGLLTASQVRDLDQATTLSGMLYFEHVARNGPVLQILTTDLYMTGHEDERWTQACLALRKRLARLIHSEIKLRPREADAAVELMIGIPAEAGSLVYSKEVDAQVGRELCRTLISSSLEALRTPEPLAALSTHHRA
jgi:AcrR family transcriptional regulator